MTIPELVDELYESFADRLGEPMRTRAQGLAFALGLASEAATPWSRVFEHDLTLAAPALFAQAMPTMPQALLRDGILAHLLGILVSLGSARLEDGQADACGWIRVLLGHARDERDKALARLWGGVVPLHLAFSDAESRTAHAVRRRSAGYARRARALEAWADHVFA